MSDKTDPETLKHWHHTFAMQCNNTAWDLAARETRTPVDDHHMRSAAFASAYHWAQLGAPLNDARADMIVAHVLALLNQGLLALEYARRRLSFFESQSGEDWDLLLRMPGWPMPPRSAAAISCTAILMPAPVN